MIINFIKYIILQIIQFVILSQIQEPQRSSFSVAIRYKIVGKARVFKRHALKERSARSAVRCRANIVGVHTFVGKRYLPKRSYFIYSSILLETNDFAKAI
jgi:hypothetical protein